MPANSRTHRQPATCPPATAAASPLRIAEKWSAYRNSLRHGPAGRPQGRSSSSASSIPGGGGDPRPPSLANSRIQLTLPPTAFTEGNLPLRATALMVQPQNFLNPTHCDPRLGHRQSLPFGKDLASSHPVSEDDPVPMGPTPRSQSTGISVHDESERPFTFHRTTQLRHAGYCPRLPTPDCRRGPQQALRAIPNTPSPAPVSLAHPLPASTPHGLRSAAAGP